MKLTNLCVMNLNKSIVCSIAKEVGNKVVHIKPKNTKQSLYVDVLRAKRPEIVIATGAAGSGKTLLGLHEGIKKLQNKEIGRIVLTRPMVSVDETLGILPGGVLEKMEPWIRPFKDVLLMHYPKATIEKMMRDDVIEVSPLATMRGSSFNNSWIVCDEAQNTTPKQMLMMLTRIGMNSKIVITGDPEQYDYGFENNGLSDILTRLQYKTLTDKWVQVVEFDENDVERHPVIPHTLSLYK